MGLLVYITVTYGQDYNFKPGEVIKLFVFLKPSALSRSVYEFGRVDEIAFGDPGIFRRSYPSV